MDCYVVWNFAENKEGAQQFLIDYIDGFHDAFKASRVYNFPCFEKTVPDLKQAIASDPAADPADEYKVLECPADPDLAGDRVPGSQRRRCPVPAMGR